MFLFVPTWLELRATFAPPPPDVASMPRSFLERLAAELGPLDVDRVLVKAAQLLASVTTQSCANPSRFMRVG